MSDNRIDLLPEAVRLRCQQGLRTGRYVGAVILALVMVVATAGHSRFLLERAQERHKVARNTADLLLQTDAKAMDITAKLRGFEREIERHQHLALPLRLTSLLATLVNRLPESVSLDRLDMSIVPAGQHTGGRMRGGAAGGATGEQPRRMIVGELAGFAASDHDISSLIHALEHTPPLSEISLDFSRTRAIRGHAAREFRISFRFNPDTVFEEQATGNREQGIGTSQLQSTVPNPQSPIPNPQSPVPDLLTDAR